MHKGTKLGRELLRLHCQIRAWVEVNRDRVAPNLIYAVEWVGCAIFYAGANGPDVLDAEELLREAAAAMKIAFSRGQSSKS